MSYVGDLFASLLAHRRIEGDDENNAILDAIIGMLADAFDRVGLVAFGDPEAGVDGSRVLSDPRVAPLWALPHAALYMGAVMPKQLAGEPDDVYLVRARDAVVYSLGIKRGSHEAVRRAAKPFLTGTKTVFISDNFLGDPYHIFVRTLVEETPDPALVERALAGDFVSGGAQGAIRAELQLTYAATDYVSFAEATLRWIDVAPTVTWRDATREDVT